MPHTEDAEEAKSRRRASKRKDTEYIDHEGQGEHTQTRPMVFRSYHSYITDRERERKRERERERDIDVHRDKLQT